jgi:MoaA/NifB/PqqE/SkfB family radical SAM enzyme
MNPVDAVLAVTWRCNAKCRMCGIWKQEPGQEIAPEVFAKLPRSLRDINLSGGEPFIRSDLPEVHRACRQACPDAQTIISTNGILTDRIVAMTLEMAKTEPNIGLAISMDGPKAVHDWVRGVNGTFIRAMTTVRNLQKAGITNLRLAYTATRDNLLHMKEVYQFAHDLGIQFTCAIEHSSEHFFHTNGRPTPLPPEDLAKQLEPIMRDELRSLSPKRWARAYFMYGLYQFAIGRGRLLPTQAGKSHFFMDPQGEVFSSNAAPFRMGNLKEQDFDALWQSPEANAARASAAEEQPGSWMICTARSSIKSAWPRVLSWALRRKFLGLNLRLPESGS